MKEITEHVDAERNIKNNISELSKLLTRHTNTFACQTISATSDEEIFDEEVCRMSIVEQPS